MKKIDDIGLLECKFVSNLFEYSTKMKDCSSKVFVKSYIFSSIPKIVSSKSFIFDSLDVPGAYENIKKEKKLSTGSEVYPSYVMAWIGYIMKYFSYTTGIPETTIYKNIKPKEFYSMYEAYHSLDNDLVVKRIAEAKNINLNLNDPELYRKLNFKKV